MTTDLTGRIHVFFLVFSHLQCGKISPKRSLFILSFETILYCVLLTDNGFHAHAKPSFMSNSEETGQLNLDENK